MLFGSRDLHIWFEMITCKVETGQVVRVPRTERLPTRTIFSDTYFKYDENFLERLQCDPIGRRNQQTNRKNLFEDRRNR